MAEAPVRVAALYQFTHFAEAAALRGPLLDACKAAGAKGTLLLAREGINGTIAAHPEGIDAVLAHIRALPGCAALDVKYSEAAAMPFYRMKVRLKKEIVTLGQPGVDAMRNAGTYVEPEAWNALIADPDTILIDTRNDYEVEIGTFAGAIDPETASFRDFPDWFRAHREALFAGKANPKVAMFCTGGIRCEKATAFLKAEGVAEVHHLKGGILRYLEEIPPEQSLWEGECFVFDQRVAVSHGLVEGEASLCHGCRRPVTPEGRQSLFYIEGVACAACHDERDETQRAGYAERARQMEIAERRGAAHVGWVAPDTE